MTPSLLLLTICTCAFIFLATLFSAYLLKVTVLAKKVPQEPFTTITHFAKAEKKQDIALGHPIAAYKMAKAK